MMKKIVISFLTIICSGVSFYFSMGFHDLWWLAWVAPIPVLVYAYQNNFLSTLSVVFIAGLAVGLNGIVGYWSTVIPMTNFIVSCVIQSAEWTVVVLLSRLLMRRICSPLSIFAYPTCLALLEWVESLSPQGTFDTIAYSQLHILPVMQIASVTGFFGVSFILALFAASIVYAIITWHDTRKALIGLLCGLIIVCLSISYGFYRIHQFHINPVQSQIKVGLISVNGKHQEMFFPQFASKVFAIYKPIMVSLVQQKAEILLLPEETLTVTSWTKQQYQFLFSNFARQYHVQLIVGIHEQGRLANYNSAWVFSNTGRWMGEYHKRHFVPQVEIGFIPGVSLLPLNIKGVLAGISICRDMDYPNPANDYGKLHTQILFVPAWDFDVDAKVHAAGAWMRGIENGYTLVRSARNGFLSVSTPTGEFIARAPGMGASTKSSTVVVASIYQNSSFYAKHPKVFVAILCGLFLMLMLLAFCKRKFNLKDRCITEK